MRSLARSLLSLAFFAVFGAGALLLSPVAALLGRPERCHFAVRLSWRALLWMFEAARLIRVERGGLPRCRGCVIAANHPSLIDAVILAALVPKTLFVAKHSLKANPFMSLIVRAASLPDDAALPQAARAYLEKGWNVLVFPEGTRSPAVGLRPFRRGAAQTALRCGAPVVAAAVRQSRRILGKDQFPWEMGRSRVVYTVTSAPPARFRREHGETMRAAAARATEAVRGRCAELLGLAPRAEAPAALRNVAAAVPVFNPEPALPELCRALLGAFGTVLVVDDGSVEARDAFDELPPGVEIARHGRNMGKGAAMKTAFAALAGRADGVVFVDGDGQHAPADALAVAARMLETGRAALGVRDLSAPGVPARSRAGNAWMRYFLELFCGADVSDTQTGLRAFPSRLYGLMLDTPGSRFEYETAALAALRFAGEGVEEVPVATIYAPGPRKSHHRPFRDSVRIWSALAAAALPFSRARAAAKRHAQARAAAPRA